jgi:hypothetical protein
MTKGKDFDFWAGVLRAMVVAAAFLFVSWSAAYAQVDTGSIIGTIKDTSGGVVPGATVKLTNDDTGLVQTTTTGSAGEYIFTPIKIGHYSLTAEFKSFSRVELQHLTVDVQQRVLADLVLTPGAATETVIVTQEPPTLQTQDASVGQVVEARAINDLPLNGRNFTFLAQLSAGVTQDQQDTRGLGASGSFSANGLRPAQNNYLLDGLDNNSNLVDFLNGTSFAIRPPIDALQEFKIQTGDYSAELGRSAGAVLNATIKSGTNGFHGNAWEFLRNDKLDAANFFENAGGLQKGRFQQNQFGGTVGGPIRKNKTFIFGDYEGTRIRQAVPYVSTVPTALMRSSEYTNFSELLNQGGTRTDVLGRTTALGQIFDPSTTRAVSCGVPDTVTGIVVPCGGGMPAGSPIGFAREPFAGNILPANRLDPNAIKLLNLFPTPRSPNLFNNYTSNPVLSSSVNQFDIRLDHNFSDNDRIFGRGSYANSPQFVPGPFGGIADGGSFSAGNQTTIATNWVVSETHQFSSTLINEARGGFNSISAARLQPNANTMGIPAQFGIQGVPQVALNGGLGEINLTGLNRLGSNGYLPSNEYSSTPQFTDNLTKNLGAHSLKVGYQYQQLRFSILQPPEGRGNFSFSGLYTDVPTNNDGNTGAAQLLLTPIPGTVPGAADYVGGADSVAASNIATTKQKRNYDGVYFQDDYHVTSKLTVNLGLRWEYFGQLIETQGEQSNFLPSSSGPSQFLLTNSRCKTPLSADFYTAAAADNIDIVCSGAAGLGHSQMTNFSPRLGFAYQLTSKLVARGGYGIFFGGFENSVVETYVDFPFQFALSYPNLTPNAPVTFPNGSIGTLENGLLGIPLEPSAVEPGGVSFTGEDYHTKTPATQSYNLTFQYQLASNDSIQAGYVGNTVRHLGVYTNPNSPAEILPPGLNTFAYSPYPDFQNSFTYTSFAADSSYNSLQTNYEHRFSQGLSVLANFTWSQCRTDAVDVLNSTAISGRGAARLPGFGIRGDSGLCDFDIRHVFHLSGIYEFPVGRGKRFLADSSGVANAFLGGWTMNWILPLETGQPGTVPCAITTTSGFGCYANVVPGQNVLGGVHNVDHWLNPAAFASPPVATTIGQSSYAPLGGPPSQFSGPAFRRLDLSLFKEFATSEKTHLEFRAEFFNLTNTPNFSLPGFGNNGVSGAPGALDYTSTTFGQINSTRDGQNDQREIQFALKFYY